MGVAHKLIANIAIRVGIAENFVPYSLLPTPYSLFPVPYSLFPLL
ncbi:hypothetical protein [Moorena bouillonii]|nr:hypothetical protein [Moorena bouillonii]